MHDLVFYNYCYQFLCKVICKQFHPEIKLVLTEVLLYRLLFDYYRLIYFVSNDGNNF